MKKDHNLDNPLTNRELEILKFLRRGFSSKMTADTLYISPRTVETHRQNMLKKSNCHNTPELILWAIKHDILQE